MTQVLIAFLLFTSAAYAYVPTVESLFRFGSNPDVTTNGVSISLVVRKLNLAEEESESTVKDKKVEEYYKIYLTKTGGDTLKVAQARFGDASFSESSLNHKIYYPNFTPHTLKPTVEQMEKGLFYSLLHSIIFNNGSQLVSYLKDLGVPVKHNSELINREKIDYLASYKRYLVTIGQNRAAKKTEVNPLRPEDTAARERAESVMNESMYVDTNQVKLGRDDGVMAWMVTAGAFESVVSYQERSVQKFKFKSAAGELSILCKDYWLANGTHFFPKYFQIKDFSGENFQVEVVEFSHYNEKEDDLVRRSKRWDQILKGKGSTEPRPEFLL